MAECRPGLRIRLVGDRLGRAVMFQLATLTMARPCPRLAQQYSNSAQAIGWSSPVISVLPGKSDHWAQ